MKLKKFDDYLVGPHAFYFLRAARNLGITITPLLPPDIFSLTYRKKSLLINRAKLSLNNQAASSISVDKLKTGTFLRSHGIKVIEQAMITPDTNIPQLTKHFTGPWVLKPTQGFGGTDVFLNIQNSKQLTKRARPLFGKYPTLIVEHYNQWNEYRVFVLDGEIVETAVKVQKISHTPANSAYGALLSPVNEHQLEGQIALELIQSVKILGLRYAAIDVKIEFISHPDSNYRILEINSAPGVRGLYTTSFTSSSDICEKILKRVFKL